MLQMRGYGMCSHNTKESFPNRPRNPPEKTQEMQHPPVMSPYASADYHPFAQRKGLISEDEYMFYPGRLPILLPTIFLQKMSG